MKYSLFVTLALGLFAMTACATPTGGAGSGGAGGQGCSTELFDGDNLDENDGGDTIAGSGRFANPRDLPGATESDWGGEADSFRVGSAATVQVWAQENFAGATQTYQPGAEQTNAEEFSSMEITCG